MKTFNKLITLTKLPWKTVESMSELLQDLKELAEEEHSPTILKGGKAKMCTTTTRGNNIIQFQGAKKVLST